MNIAKMRPIYRKMDELLAKDDIALYSRLYVKLKKATGGKKAPLLEKGKYSEEIEQMRKSFALSGVKGKGDVLMKAAKMPSYETMKFAIEAAEEIFRKKIPAREKCIFSIVMMLRNHNLQNSLIREVIERKIPEDVKSMILVMGTCQNTAEKAALAPHLFKIFQRRYKG